MNTIEQLKATLADTQDQGERKRLESRIKQYERQSASHCEVDPETGKVARSTYNGRGAAVRPLNTTAKPETQQGQVLQFIFDQGGTWKYEHGGRYIESAVLTQLQYKGLVEHNTDGSWTLTADKVPTGSFVWVPSLTRVSA